MSEARIGPHEVKRTLVAGPGLELAEAVDASGARILLQLLRLRSPTDGELEALRRLERGLAKVTTALFDAFSISTHAGVDTPEGARILFWALPWPPFGFFDPARGRRLSEAEALETARFLIERARRLTALGVHDPALSEAALLVTSAGVPCDVAGLPVSAPRTWLANPELGARLLPEEEAGELTIQGDLYRIGSALSSITAPTGLSTETRVLFAKLCDRVFPDLESALGAVRRRQESLLEASGLSRKSEPAPSSPVTPAELPEPSRAPDGPDWGAMFGDLDDTLIPSPADATEPPRRAVESELTAPPAPRVPAPVHPEPAELADLGSDLEEDIPLDEEPVWADADLLSEPGGRPAPWALQAERGPPPARAASGRAAPARPPSSARTAPVPVSASASVPVPVPVPVPVQPAAPSPPDVPLSLDASAAERASPEVLISSSIDFPGPDAASARSSVVQALAAQKAAWAPPVFAEGASPWSEIVETQGAHRSASGQFPGYAESLPGVAPESIITTLIAPTPVAPEPVSPPPVSRPPPRPPEPAPPSVVRPPPPGPSRGAPRLLLAAVVAVLVLFGAVAAFMRSQPEPIDALGSLVAGPVNHVNLDSQPSDAKVVAEADGRLLGRTPMDFLVPPNANPVVLVVARGFEPQRVVLPERGALQVRLLPLPQNSLCEIDLVGPPETRLEGIEFELSAPTAARVPGSAVVRAVEGQSVAGARLLRCPAVGGSPRVDLRFDKRWAPATLRITAPAGASAYVDEEPAGTVPTSHRSSRAFARVRVVDAKGRAVERWVPTRTDTELGMPSPESRALEVHAGELPDDVDAAGESEEPGAIEPIIEEEGTKPALGRPKKLSRADRDRVGRLLREGNRLLLSGQVSRAQVAFETCLRIDEATAACHRSLGTLHRRQDDRKAAKEHLARYVELAPDAPDVPAIRRILKSLD